MTSMNGKATGGPAPESFSKAENEVKKGSKKEILQAEEQNYGTADELMQQVSFQPSVHT